MTNADCLHNSPSYPSTSIIPIPLILRLSLDARLNGIHMRITHQRHLVGPGLGVLCPRTAPVGTVSSGIGGGAGAVGVGLAASPV